MLLTEKRDKRREQRGEKRLAMQRHGRWQAIAVLFKLRVVSLLLLAAVGGAFLGARGWPGWGNLAWLVLTGGCAAAGAAAINQYLERERDGQMQRTRQRPLVTGQIGSPQRVLVFALALILLPSLAVFPLRPALALFNWLGAFIYVVVYTVWLKPRTLLNIVIGGAAGSAAVLSGGAAVGMGLDPAVVALAGILFLWTPAHFWSLALLYRHDYQRVETPMLPTRTSPRHAAWWVLAHTIPTALGAALLAVLPELGWLYLLPVGCVTAVMGYHNLALIRQPSAPHARRLFLTSNIYLMVLLLSIGLSTTVHGWLNF